MAFAAPSSGGPSWLEDGATRESVSAECRAAALELMSGVARGWDKVDLVRWLTGPYAQATRHHPRGERTVASSTARSSAAPIAAETIEGLLITTRQRMLAVLEKAVLSDGTLDFDDHIVDRGFVRQAIDANGNEVWVPINAARLRLKDRLSSLFVADYLNDPVSYTTLYVCHRCEAVVFDETAKRLGICNAHRRISGIVARNDDAADDDNDNVYIGMLPPPIIVIG